MSERIHGLGDNKSLSGKIHALRDSELLLRKIRLEELLFHVGINTRLVIKSIYFEKTYCIIMVSHRF